MCEAWGHVAEADGRLWEIAHNPDAALLLDGRIELPGE